MLKHRLPKSLSTKITSFTSYISPDDGYIKEVKSLSSKPSFLSYLNTKEDGNENVKEEKVDKTIVLKEKTTVTTFSKVVDQLQELRNGNNLEKFLEAHFGSEFKIPPQLRSALEKFLSSEEEKNKEIRKWEEQISNMREFTDDKKLEKWMESLGTPGSNVNIDSVKNELQKFFSQGTENVVDLNKKNLHEPHWGKQTEKGRKENGEIADSKKLIDNKTFIPSAEKIDYPEKLPATKPLKGPRAKRDFGPCMRVEDFKGRSILLQEETLAGKLWQEFRGLSIPKQVAIVVGITVATAALGFVSWRILLLAMPSALNMSSYWVDVLSQWFMQRQESTFNLLQHTAQNAKPLSTAWANQYILWKYI